MKIEAILWDIESGQVFCAGRKTTVENHQQQTERVFENKGFPYPDTFIIMYCENLPEKLVKRFVEKKGYLKDWWDLQNK